MKLLKHLIYSLISSLLVAATLLAQNQSPTPISTTFTTLAPDLEIYERSGLTFFRTALKRYRVGAVRAREFGWQRASVRSLARASQAILAVNANFFDQAGKPLGLIISRGTMVQDLHRGGNVLTGIFLMRSTLKLEILHRSDFKRDGVLEAFQSGPRLLEGRQRITGLKDAEIISRRSGVCIDSNGRLIIFTSSSNLAGIGLAALQDILLSPELNCKDALNFDGGRSAQLYLSEFISGASTNHRELNIQGVEEVPVVLGIFAK